MTDGNLLKLADELRRAIGQMPGYDKPENLLNRCERALRASAQAAVPFLCPCCGARGSTDGKASTVSSAHRGGE